MGAGIQQGKPDARQEVAEIGWNRGFGSSVVESCAPPEGENPQRRAGIGFKNKVYSGLSSPLMGSLSENIESEGFSDCAPACWTARYTFLFRYYRICCGRDEALI